MPAQIASNDSQNSANGKRTTDDTDEIMQLPKLEPVADPTVLLLPKQVADPTILLLPVENNTTLKIENENMKSHHEMDVTVREEVPTLTSTIVAVPTVPIELPMTPAIGGIIDTNKWSKNGFGEGVQHQKIGKFSKEESEIICRAVQNFCATRNIPVKKLCSETDHRAELKGAWMEIAKRLPHRSVQSVYRHGLRQLHPFKRGAWSADEVTMLIDLVTKVGKKWASIQAKLNRSADSCRDKYREMSNEYVKGRWKDNEVEKLKSIIRSHLNVDPDMEMKELGEMVKREGIVIPWSSLSRQMGKRSRLSCFKKWQKLTGLYSPSDSLYQKMNNSNDIHDNNYNIQNNSSTTDSNNNQCVDAIVETEDIANAGNVSMVVDMSCTLPVDLNDISMTQPKQLSIATSTTLQLPAITATETPTNQSDYDDIHLLGKLVNLEIKNEEDVSWDNLHLKNAHERWIALLQEWQNNENKQTEQIVAGADSIAATAKSNLPLSEIAQLLLDRKRSAKMAAETVEAVNLPTPETLSGETLVKV